MTNLPGLACLNNPNAIQPITEKLPQFIRAKWEKEILEQQWRSVSPFSRFSKIVREQAHKAANLTQVSALKPRKEKKTLKTETRPTAGKDRTGEKKREAPEKKKELRLNIALIRKETDMIYRSAKRSQQNP